MPLALDSIAVEESDDWMTAREAGVMRIGHEDAGTPLPKRESVGS